MPLFGPEGLGLDSIDVLELVLELERSFGVTIENQETGMQVLRSVDTIAAFIQANRGRAGLFNAPDTVINALTVDVEEWFHICGVRDSASRWGELPSTRRADDPAAARLVRPRRCARHVFRARLDRRALSSSR